MNLRTNNQTGSIDNGTGRADATTRHCLTSTATSCRELTTALSRWRKHSRWRAFTSPTV